MSERKMLLIGISTLLLTLVIAVAAYQDGIKAGRAEMKRWQDDYYASHPVVKEVPAKETSVKDDGTLIIYGDKLPNSCEQKNGYMECSYKIIALPHAPKPQKGSKLSCADPSKLQRGWLGVWEGDCWSPFDKESMGHFRFDDKPVTPDLWGCHPQYRSREEAIMKTTGWFAMIRHQKGFPMPLVDEQEDVVLFDTEEEAAAAAKQTLMGETFGYEIYEW